MNPRHIAAVVLMSTLAACATPTQGPAPMQIGRYSAWAMSDNARAAVPQTPVLNGRTVRKLHPNQ